MDILSVIGVILAFVAIIGGNYLEGGHATALLNGPAGLIVIGGTLGAAFIQTPLTVFKRALAILPWIIFPPANRMREGISQVINWSTIARKEGLLGLESMAELEPDNFARKGLQLLVDGSEPEALRSIMEVDLVNKEHGDLMAAKVYECMGGYAPTIGIIGGGDGAYSCDGQSR